MSEETPAVQEPQEGAAAPQSQEPQEQPTPQEPAGGEDTPPDGEAPAASEPHVELTPEAENVKSILAAAELNPDILNDPEVKALVDEANKMKNPGAKPEGETPASITGEGEEQEGAEADPADGTTDEPEDETTEGTEDDTTDDTTEEGEEGAEGDDSSLFSSKPESKIPTSFNDFGDVVEFMYAQYGLNDKDPKALTKHFNSINKWRNDSQKLSESQNKMDDVESYFNSLPEPLYQALTDFNKGEDWQESLNGKTLKLDFKKDFSNHKLGDVMNYYFPNDYTEEDLKGDEAVVAKAKNLAEKQYNIDRKSFDQKRAEYDRTAQSHQKDVKASVDSSVKKLRESFPELSTNAERKVRKALSSGDVTNLFMNADGTYKEDAGEKLVLAMFGKEEIDRLVKKESKKAASKATEKVVTRASDKPSSRRSQEVPAPTTEEDTRKRYADLYETPTY